MGAAKLHDPAEQEALKSASNWESRGGGGGGGLRVPADGSSKSEAAALSDRFSAEYAEEVRQDFQTVRILVIGKSGAGKSTLIRRLFGLDPDAAAGPAPGGSSGRAGAQDIAREWRHPTLPIVVHDSNGVGSAGAVDVAAVAEFLESRQRDPDPARRVHLAWYVVSALDNRALDDAGLLSAVVAAGGGPAAAAAGGGGGETPIPDLHLPIPLQLVVTHADQDPRGRAYARNVAPHLDALLRGAGVPPDRADAVKLGLVKVGNDPDGAADLPALRALSDRTAAALAQRAEEQARSWAAAQTVDAAAKARASARLIVRHKLWAVLSAPLGVPLAPLNQWRMQALLEATCAGLCRLWAVPAGFEDALGRAAAPDPDTLAGPAADSKNTFAKALWALVLAKGAGTGVTGGSSSTGTSSVPLPAAAGVALRLGAAAGLEVSPAVVAGIGLAAALVTASVTEAYASRAAVLNYAMAVGGAIVYARAVHPGSLSMAEVSAAAAAGVSPHKEYRAVLDEFAAKHQSELQRRAEETRSVFLEPFERDAQRLAIERLLMDFFLSLLPTSGPA